MLYRNPLLFHSIFISMWAVPDPTKCGAGDNKKYVASTWHLLHLAAWIEEGTGSMGHRWLVERLNGVGSMGPKGGWFIDDEWLLTGQQLHVCDSHRGLLHAKFTCLYDQLHVIHYWIFNGDCWVMSHPLQYLVQSVLAQHQCYAVSGELRLARVGTW